MTGAPALAAIYLPGGDIGRRCIGAIEFEGKGEVSVRAAFLESVAPDIEVADAKVAARETLSDDIVLSLFAPLSGVVATVVERVVEVEELTERYHHARTAFVGRWNVGGVQVCRC